MIKRHLWPKKSFDLIKISSWRKCHFWKYSRWAFWYFYKPRTLKQNVDMREQSRGRNSERHISKVAIQSGFNSANYMLTPESWKENHVLGFNMFSIEKCDREIVEIMKILINKTVKWFFTVKIGFLQIKFNANDQYTDY